MAESEGLAENDALREWAEAMSEHLTTHPDHDLTAEDVVGNALARTRVLGAPERTFTAEEVIEIANETSDSLGNLYRLDFIDRIRHEAEPTTSPGLIGGGGPDA